MENATKALLIAAAVLVAILIISLGVGVFNMASETMGDVDLNQQEIQAFNQKFENYIDTDIRGTKVNALVQEVFSHNLSQTEATKRVAITVKESGDKGEALVSLSGTETTAPTKVDTGRVYDATATYSSTTGLITTITVTQK